MCPFIHANYFVLAGAVIASFIFGSLWYGPIFGKMWSDLVGRKQETSAPEPWVIIGTLIGTIFTTFVLAYFQDIYKPYCSYGAAFFIWLGFYLPVLFGAVAWEGKPWNLLFLNGAYYFLNLQLISAILSFWR